jgi:ATP-dependent Clp protease ATP-binding subunit ClpA
MPQPFNADAQKVIRIAQHLAEQGDGVVSPFHVLSALLAAAPQVWEALPQVNAQEVRAGLPPFKTPQSVSTEKSNAVLANSVKRIFAYSREEWFRAGANRVPFEQQRHDFLYSGEYVTPEHLLLGLMREADPDAARLLATQGLTVEEARNHLSDLD